LRQQVTGKLKSVEIAGFCDRHLCREQVAGKLNIHFFRLRDRAALEQIVFYAPEVASVQAVPLRSHLERHKRLVKMEPFKAANLPLDFS